MVCSVKCGNNAEIIGSVILAKYGLKIVIQFVGVGPNIMFAYNCGIESKLSLIGILV